MLPHFMVMFKLFDAICLRFSELYRATRKINVGLVFLGSNVSCLFDVLVTL